LILLQEPAKDSQLAMPQLPADVLAQVLAHLPQQHRLIVCSTASSSMQTAAVAATRNIKVTFWNRHSWKLDALREWLSKYDSTHAVQHMDFDVKYKMPGIPKAGGYLDLALPWQRL
jgi:hypothetical protein